MSEVHAVPYERGGVHGGFRLLSDGEAFLLVTTVTTFWPGRFEMQAIARRTSGDFEWSEPTYAPPETVDSNYVSPRNSVFDGSRYAMVFPTEGTTREISFSRDGSFVGSRTLLEGSSAAVLSVAPDGLDSYSMHVFDSESRQSVVVSIDRDGSTHSEMIADINVHDHGAITAMPAGPYALVTRREGASDGALSVSTNGSGAGFVYGSDLTDSWRTLAALRLFADEDGFIAVFRPAFRGPPLTPADRPVVRRIDRMGALVGDEMPLDGIAQVEAVASAGRSEMAVVYRADLDPIAPGNQLSELRARIVNVPSVPIE